MLFYKSIKIFLAILVFGYSGIVFSNSLQVTGPAKGVAEVDLRHPTTKKIIKTVDANKLNYPITIISDQQMGFIINVEGKSYYVMASDVTTNKVYKITSECANQMASPTAASRGIAGKGCN